MLTLLKIVNVALIDELEAEFGPGLNLLTGETGSGKSIIVDSLGALTGERVSSDLIKDGKESARIEGLFVLHPDPILETQFSESGVDLEGDGAHEVIIRREISASGKNRVFVNNQLVTAAFLKRIAHFLVDIHGQGEQAALFEPASHRAMLDRFAGADVLLDRVAASFDDLTAVRQELDSLKKDEAEKLQLLDILRFQVDELRRAALSDEESAALETEKRRLNNVEKLSSLSGEAYAALYEDDGSTIATLGQAIGRIKELGEFDPRFAEYVEGMESAAAVLDDVSITLRDFRSHLEFSPERLEEIESRLAEISRITRKYGGSVEAALDHLADAEGRLENIELSEQRQAELAAKLIEKRNAYLSAAKELSSLRQRSSGKFEKTVAANLADVALEKARFEVKIKADPENESAFSTSGIDRVEFLFSANPGEPAKPLARVASGGEASRLMLILKTVSRGESIKGKTAVFDEIDAGIGGRVAEAVGLKLKQLAQAEQVLCVTHQAQVASKADRHFVVEKMIEKDRTSIGIRELNNAERVEEVARMLAGEKITEAARENAREMLAAAG